MEIVLKNKTPKITGTFNVCPIPYKYDTYIGCTFGCKYCFARDIVQFARKTHKKSNLNFNKFEYIIGANIDYFKKWVNNTLCKEYTSSERIAFKERIPIKIGVMSDPFPYIERKYKITYETLKILNNIDYPIQISTKNPLILAEYIDDFIINDRKPNWALSVTMTTIDENVRKQIEPNTPSVEEKLKAIKTITSKGVDVVVRIQPVIYPYIMNIYKEFIFKLKEVGVSGVILEGLKIKVAMPKEEQDIYEQIGKCLGYNIREWYKTNGEKNGSDYVISTKDKEKYINLIKLECKQYNIDVYVGDNECRNMSCDKECCGTKKLRNHKIITESEKLLNCKIKNTRSKNNINKTIGGVINGNK